MRKITKKFDKVLGTTTGRAFLAVRRQAGGRDALCAGLRHPAPPLHPPTRAPFTLQDCWRSRDLGKVLHSPLLDELRAIEASGCIAWLGGRVAGVIA